MGVFGFVTDLKSCLHNLGQHRGDGAQSHGNPPIGPCDTLRGTPFGVPVLEQFPRFVLPEIPITPKYSTKIRVFQNI
jgi:hypothetical protein